MGSPHCGGSLASRDDADPRTVTRMDRRADIRDSHPVTLAAPASTDVCADQCSAGECTPSPQRDDAWLSAARTVRVLSWASLLWMTGEGVLGLIAGAAAGSISLIGWALGSAIEGIASVIVIWRFNGSRTLSETSERRAQKAVAVSFYLLSLYIAVESLRSLVIGHESRSSALGVVVTAVSVVAMPGLGMAKRRLGRRLHSNATSGEGAQNLLCAAQAGAVLIGLGATAAWGSSWIDPAIGLLLAAVALREGRGAWRGQACC